MKDVKSVLKKYAELEQEKSVAVLLSGGIDSASVLFSLLDAGKHVTAYTFMLDGALSTDFINARYLARNLRINFSPVFLPRDYDEIYSDLKYLAFIGAKSKTDFECSFPILHTYKAIKENVVYSGMGADGHFCISKKGMIHYKYKIDTFRLGLYRNPRYAQQQIHNSIAKLYKKKHIAPYLTSEMRAEFLGTSWNEVNKPKQKQPIIDAIGNRASLLKKLLPHQNLQLGDSGISEHLAGLVRTKYNTKNHKSVVGIYNSIASGR